MIIDNMEPVRQINHILMFIFVMVILVRTEKILKKLEKENEND